MSKRRKVIVILIVLPIVAFSAVDYFEYNMDIASCLSDNLSTIQGSLERFAKDHAGRMPESMEELKTFWDSNKPELPLEAYWHCQRRNDPLLWRPAGLQTTNGSPVVVMCPQRSHGFLRKYAWGMVDVAGDVRFVRVEASRVVPYKWE